MRPATVRPAAIVFAALTISCGDTGQPALAHSAVAIGTQAHPVEIGEFVVTLEAARVAFGPAKFCASRAASDELCPAALAELASVASFDALSGDAQPIGTVRGFVGTVRSAGFGYGIAWMPSWPQPRAGSAAPGGHSAHLEGTVTSKITGASFRFVGDIDVTPRLQGTFGVNSSGIDTPITEGTRRLTITLDPTAWLAQVDFAELAALGTETVNLQDVPRTVNAVEVGMTALAPVRFTWER